MRQVTPGKVLVVFYPKQRIQTSEGEDLQTPWACEVSAVPREGDFVAYFDASAPKHPERRVRVHTAVDKNGLRRVKSWGWGEHREVHRAGKALYVPDLDVYLVEVKMVRDPRSAIRLKDCLRGIAQALDVDEPQETFDAATLEKVQR